MLIIKYPERVIYMPAFEFLQRVYKKPLSVSQVRRSWFFPIIHGLLDLQTLHNKHRKLHFTNNYVQ